MGTAIASVIRPAVSSDYDAYGRLYAELESEYILTMPGDWERFERPRTFVAAKGDRVVGFVSILPPTGHVTHLAVDPEWRQHGIGTQLLDAAAQALRVRGHHSWTINVKAGNVSAIRLYERFRFRPVSLEHELRVPWVAYRRLPKLQPGARVLGPGDAWPPGFAKALSSWFESPAAPGDIALIVVDDDDRLLGGCVFSPSTSRCSGLHLARNSAIGPLLHAMARHRDPEARAVLVRMADGILSRALRQAGARPVLSVLHMRGEIPAVRMA